jgi:cytoskeletal protein CcmA (bactofilin family)
MHRVIAFTAVLMTIVWGCGWHGMASGDLRNINGVTVIDGPLFVHGSLTVDGPAIIHGVVRARKINVNGPMLGTLGRNETPGAQGRQFANATAVHGVLKVRGSLDVDGELTVNGPLVCEKANETAAMVANASAPAPEDRHVFGFSSLQHFLGLPLK